jgi:hypothetical protein
LVVGLFLAIDAEFEFAFFRPQHDGLAVHAPDHVKGCFGTAAQRHFKGVFTDAILDGFAQLMLDFKEAVCRTHAADALMGALVIVVLDPQADALAGLLIIIELGTSEEFTPDRVPETLDLAQGHRMMGSGTDVGDPVLGHFILKAARSTPSRILAAVVGEHFLGDAKLRSGPPIDFYDGLRRLTAKQIDTHDEPRVIIHEGNQIGVVPTQPEAENVALPHLIGSGPLEKAGFGGIALRSLDSRSHEFLLVQRLTHRFGAGFHEEPAPQHLGDALYAPGLIGLFESNNLLPYGRGQARPFLRAAARRL